nr:tape measure protein [uncultured Trichococcus sp.]
MADGKISIAIEVDGKQVKVASTDLDKLAKSAEGSGSPLKDTEKGLEGIGNQARGAKKPLDDAKKGIGGVGDESKKANTSIKDMAISFGLVKVASAAFKVVAQSLDAAISRFDTMQKYPKVLGALGFSAEESEKSIKQLADGIDGLPTKLDDVVASTQQMTSITGDLGKSTDTVLALNNAFLASGASAADASRGTNQFVQMLSSGVVDLQSWKTLQETMPLGLQKTAEAMGYVGSTAQRDLYGALKSGEITFRDFQNQLIELGIGTGVLADLAKENSMGIATSFGNLRNAVAKNIANIITKVDEMTQAVTGKSIAENIDSLKVIINSSMASIGESIEKATPYVIAFKDGVQATLPVVEFLTPAIMGLVAAYTALQIISKVNAQIAATKAAFELMAPTIAKLTALTTAKTTAELMDSAMQTKYLAANLASMSALTAKNVVVGLLTGSLTLNTAATLLQAKAVVVLSGALKFITGPIGWVVLGIGALVTAGVALVKWFNKATEDGAKLTSETEDLATANESLADTVESSADAYKKNQSDIQATADANSDLIAKIEELYAVEDKTSTQKKELSAYVEQLNGSMAGLNLAYSEEADMLNQSSEYLQQRVDLLKEQETANAAQERMLEISKEQSEVEQKLAETNVLREEWNQKLADGSVKSREHKAAIAELDEQEKLLKDTTLALGDEQKLTEAKFTESMAAIDAATSESIGSQIITYADLSESQAAAVESMKATWEDYKAAATNMFDVLSEESELSVAEMTANMEENQRVIGAWADNIAILAARGVDEGLLETLRAAGPESAGYVKAMVDSSDEELSRMSEVYANGMGVATDAAVTTLDEGNAQVFESVKHLVTGTEQTMNEQIAAADFGSIGKNVAAGLTDGINEGAAEAVAASETMAQDTIDGAESAFEINSPSRVFKGMGGFITEGLALGVNTGTRLVLQAITSMFNQARAQSMAGVAQIIASYNGLPNSMRSIGLYAMSGLNGGLMAGSGSVLATARSIANSVAATMQAALKINSPSRVMRDDVGRWIPEGLAEGIRGNAASVYEEINRISAGVVKGGSPEMALGLNGMTALSAGYATINNNSRAVTDASQTITNNNRPVIHIEKIENHSDSDIPKILEESAWILSREGSRL